MKKVTLINKLQKIAENINNVDLPAEVTKIYAFGSILREKEDPNDIDLIVLHQMNPEQAARWEEFEKNFSDNHNDTHSVRLLEKSLAPYRAKGIALSEAVKNAEVSDILQQHGVKPTWAGCFSWNAVFGYNPYGFSPSLDFVMYRMIFGRGTKGFQVRFLEGQSLSEGQIPTMSARNHWLAWSKEKPNVKENLLGRSSVDKVIHDTKELDHFINNEIPRYRKEFIEIKEAVYEKMKQTNMALELDALERQHKAIVRIGTESLTELSMKCEQARCEMKNYKNETDVLRIICYSLGGSVKGYSLEEYVSHQVIHFSRKRGLHESTAREILSTLGLPEDRIVTVRKHGFGTDYKLAKNMQEKNQLIAEAHKEETREKIRRQITKTVRSIDPRAQVNLETSKNGALEGLTIYVSIYTNQLDAKEIESIEDQLKQRGFNVSKTGWSLYASKCVTLQGNETLKELCKISKRMINGK